MIVPGSFVMRRTDCRSRPISRLAAHRQIRCPSVHDLPSWTDCSLFRDDDRSQQKLRQRHKRGNLSTVILKLEGYNARMNINPLIKDLFSTKVLRRCLGRVTAYQLSGPDTDRLITNG